MMQPGVSGKPLLVQHQESVSTHGTQRTAEGQQYCSCCLIKEYCRNSSYFIEEHSCSLLSWCIALSAYMYGLEGAILASYHYAHAL